jgi:hypothetical protein
MFLLKSIWRGIEGLVKLCFPFFAKARELRHPGQRLRWVLRLLILAMTLVLLGFINDWTDLERILRAPLPILRRIWLPLVFLLIYVMSWLIWWLWELLTTEREDSEFPDIDEAWDAALRALDQASIDVTQSPLFLILGSPIGTEEALLNAAKLTFEVGRTPRGADAPLHVYANRDGIYLTCPGASLLGKQSTLLAERPLTVATATGPPPSRSLIAERPAPALATRGAPPSPFEPGVLGRGPDSPDERISAPPELQELPSQPRRRRASLLKDQPMVDEQTCRLQHLCRLVVRSRRPYCPINGILFLIPFAATESAEEADEIGAICQHDRDAVRDSLEVHCPAFAVICDLEQVPGFRTFIGRFPEEQREKVLGVDLPLVPVADGSGFAKMIHDGVRWIDQVVIPTLVYRLWKLEDPDRKNAAEVLRENIQLYHVLTRLQERQDRVFRALARTFASESPDSTLFGGCYLAATGRDATHEQAFVVGVFRRLLENQNYVSWTSEVLAEDAEYRHWAILGWSSIAVFLVIVASLGYFYWSR